MEGLPPSPPLRAPEPEGWTTSAPRTLGFSEEVEPVFPMDFPYDSLTAMIAVECRRAWVHFSDTPNFNSGLVRDGYTDYRVGARTGPDFADYQSWRVRHRWGEDLVRIIDAAAEAIPLFISAPSVRIAFGWYPTSR